MRNWVCGLFWRCVWVNKVAGWAFFCIHYWLDIYLTTIFFFLSMLDAGGLAFCMRVFVRLLGHSSYFFFFWQCFHVVNPKFMSTDSTNTGLSGSIFINHTCKNYIKQGETT
ncbi:hypothetical protein BC829DRAFT_287844 [Chytridium lagenaria]|nr:hypothetical protein BC829DRAFT_287844 [Chytridium lagenaria]